MRPDLTAIRTDYGRAGLDLADLAPSPVEQIETWLGEAIAAGHPEPTAMTLATATSQGEPAARVVLLKRVDERGLVFFTNYASDKGRQLEDNPRACANIFWVLLERQLRITGAVERVSRAESEAYFGSRPRESQLGAWASEQSGIIRDRAELERQFVATAARFGDAPIPCPPHWGGYRLVPDQVECWQGRPSRLHDRLRYTRDSQGLWSVERLSP
jgi:pyridoxamine 5'-phosphate oxidase